MNRFTSYFLLVLCLFVCSKPSLAQTYEPFPIDWKSISNSELDLSQFLEAPAGKNGFVKAQGEHFVDDNGKRIRIWGVNLGATRCFPTHEEAEQLADVLAAVGINCVRFHGLDSRWGLSSIDRESASGSDLSERDMERFDYLFAQLKKRGIYGNINLNVFRTYTEKDGLPDYKDLGLGKWATHFYPKLIELQEKYARDLLNHVNPYTGNRYAEEPGVFVVEIVNENSLFEGWVNWKLIGKNDNSGDTWSPMPVVYANELNRQFNNWLVENKTIKQIEEFRKEAGVKSSEPLVLLRPDQFKKVSKDRFSADYEFITSTEIAFLKRMKKLIKNEIGLKSMLIGDADHNDSKNGYPHILNNRIFDYLDGHGYWQHPSLGKETVTRNDPMVNDPLDSTVVQFARTPMVGMPFVVSETNHPYPHRYATEGIPIMAAYALLQDWDGVVFHEWGQAVAEPKESIPDRSWFSLSYDPMKVSQLIVAGLMWHRKDIQAAKQTVVRSMTMQDVKLKTLEDSWKHRPFFDDQFSKGFPLVHKTRWNLVDKKSDSNYPEAPSFGELISDTNQLRWHGANRKRGRVAVDSPKVQALIGFQQTQQEPWYDGIQALSVNLKNEFASVILISLDDKPIVESRKMLLFACDRVANIDLTWKDDLKTVANWGDGPVSLRTVQGTISLWGLKDIGPVRASVLDPLGKRTGKSWDVENKNNGWHIQISNPGTMAILER